MIKFAILFLLLNFSLLNIHAQNKEQIKSSKKASAKIPSSTKKIVVTNPDLSFGNFVGEKVSVEDFKKNFKITFDSNYVIKSMTIFLAGAGYPNPMSLQGAWTNGSSWLTSSVFDKLQKGTIISFEQITLQGYGKLLSLRGKKFILN